MKVLSKLATGALAAAVVTFVGAGGASATESSHNYWSFEEGSGTSVVDSVNGHNLTLSGSGVAFSDDVPALDCQANSWSLAFDGTNGSADSVATSNLGDVDAMTMSLWLKPAAFPTGDYQLVFVKTQQTGGYHIASYGVWLNQNHVYAETNDNQVRGITATSALALGTWNLVTVTYDGADQKVYINGVLDTTVPLGSITIADDASKTIQLGKGPWNLPYNGNVDELTIYDRALTAEEIAGMYAGNCAPGLTAAPVERTSEAVEKSLSSTGVNPAPALAAGASLVVAGAVIAHASRRRRRKH